CRSDMILSCESAANRESSRPTYAKPSRRRVTQYSRDSNAPPEAAAYWIARSEPGDDTANGKATREQRASGRSLGLPQGRATQAQRPSARSHVTISDVGKGKCRQYPGFKGTRASANTSGPDFTLARKPLVKLRSPWKENRTERRKLVSSAGPTLAGEPAKENDPTVDLMSRRHPLSSTRTSGRR
ncbi:hypothetical protein, partial [Bradyrhizobium liaoningense]|uniref:hypothetical protein n=1 Tax=Bradyrhizobium liaoningense TaxID=43992 RepID=UPI001BA66868